MSHSAVNYTKVIDAQPRPNHDPGRIGRCDKR
jgi:hypothetical protein